MGQNEIGYLMIAGLVVWTVLALQSGDVPASLWKWYQPPGNKAKALQWAVRISAFIAIVWAFNLGETDWFYQYQSEIAGMTFTVLVIEELSSFRSYLEFKQSIMRQVRSRSNDFALDAARIALEERWLRDGSSKGAYLPWASLHRAHLYHANLQSANLNAANLSNAILYDANLKDASLFDANLQNAYLKEADLSGANLVGANLSGAQLDRANLSRIEYSYGTIWPDGFTPLPDAINVEEQSK